MNLYFFKYQGAGNDFIVIDDRKGDFPESVDLVERLCDRRFGIGSDGILLIKSSDKADLHIDFINPDGSRSFCGNGSRCGLKFAQLLGMIGDKCRFEAIDGTHEGLVSSNSVRISMTDVELVKAHPLGYFLNTGSPHLVIQKQGLETLDVKGEGSAIRYSDEFKKEGVNVNFITIEGEDNLAIRTYERGVEDETLSCGTGVTAAALSVAYEKGLSEGTLNVKSRGGDLQVQFEREGDGFKQVWLEGPAEMVFSGEFEI